MYIDLPAGFENSNSIYYFKLTPNIVLFSSDVTGIGLWAYNIGTGTSTQIYNVGENWQNFQMVDVNCLVSSNSAVGVLVVNGNDLTVVSYENTSGWNEFLQVGDDYLIIGRNATGVLFYDHLFNTIENKYNTGNWSVYSRVQNDVLITGVGAGVLFYDHENTSVTLIYNQNAGLVYSYTDGNKVFFSSNVDNGIFLYNNNDKTFSTIYNDGKNWSYCIKSGSHYLFSSNISSGIVEYNDVDGVGDKIFNNGYRFTCYQVVGNQTLLSSRDYPYNGVLLFDNSTKAISQIYASGYNWEYGNNDGIHAVLTSSTAAGVLYFNGSAITKIYDYGTNYDKVSAESGVCIIESSDTENNNRRLQCRLSDGVITVISYAVV